MWPLGEVWDRFGLIARSTPVGRGFEPGRSQSSLNSWGTYVLPCRVPHNQWYSITAVIVVLGLDWPRELGTSHEGLAKLSWRGRPMPGLSGAADEARDRLVDTFVKYKYIPKTVVYFCPYKLSNDEGQKSNFSSQKRSKFEILSYKWVMYLKRKLRLCTIQIQQEKVRFIAKN